MYITNSTENVRELIEKLDDIKDIANSLLSDDQTKNLAIEKIRNIKSKDYEL